MKQKAPGSISDCQYKNAPSFRPISDPGHCMSFKELLAANRLLQRIESDKIKFTGKSPKETSDWDMAGKIVLAILTDESFLKVYVDD